MKKCYKCKEDKPLKFFSKNASKKDGLSLQCKECHKLLRRNHYLNNKKKIIEQVGNRKKEYRKWFASLKNKPCADCKMLYPHYCMDFDHLSNKDFDVSNAFSRGWSKNTILKEIEKCELVCAVCHRKRTYKRWSGE